MRLLAQQGLVERVPRRGSRVAEWSPVDILQLFALRHVLERHAIETALPLTDPATSLQAVRTALDEMRTATDELDRDDAHRTFHAAVVGLADNRQLDIALEPILLKLQLPMAMNIRAEARQHRAHDGIERHQAILAALETNDRAAVIDALHDHGHLALSRPATAALTQSTHSLTRDRHHSVDNRQTWLLTRMDRPSDLRWPRSSPRTPPGPAHRPRPPRGWPTPSRLAATTAPGCPPCRATNCSPPPRRSRSAPVRGLCRSTACRSGSRTASTSQGVADHAGLSRLRLRRDDDRARGPAPARRRRALRRQDQSRPVRHRAERHPHAVHGAAQRVRRRHDLRRFEFGLGAGRRARPGAVRRGHRHRGLGPGARSAQRRRRLQAVARADQHRRPGSGVQVAGLHQPDGGLDRRRRPRLRRDGRPRRRRRVVPRPRAALRRRRDPGRAAAGRRAGVLRRRRDARRAPGVPRARWRGMPPIVEVPLRAVPGRRRAALPGSVGGRAAGRVRRLPRRATGFDPPGGARDPAQRREVHGGRRVRGAAAAAGTQGRRSAGCGGRWTCWSCRRSAPPSPSTRCWPTRSTATRCSATTPTSATCSTCSVSPSRWAPPPTAGPTARCCSARAQTDDTVLQLAAQMLDEPREPSFARRTTQSRSTSEERA